MKNRRRISVKTRDFTCSESEMLYSHKSTAEAVCTMLKAMSSLIRIYLYFLIKVQKPGLSALLWDVFLYQRLVQLTNVVP
jgi:hypothetical protein